MVEGLDPSSRLEGEAALLVQSASRCYVDNCPRAQIKEIEILGEYLHTVLWIRSGTHNIWPDSDPHCDGENGTDPGSIIGNKIKGTNCLNYKKTEI